MKSKKQRRIQKAEQRLLEQKAQAIADNNAKQVTNLLPPNDEPLQQVQQQGQQSKREQIQPNNDLESILDLDELEQLEKEVANVEEIKNKTVEPISFEGVEKPKFKRVVSYTNCVSTYLGQNRKVSIAQEDDDTFIIETKRTLNEGEEFKDYNPAVLNHKTKWGISVVSCKINISREAMIAIGMAFNEMLADGKIK